MKLKLAILALNIFTISSALAYTGECTRPLGIGRNITVDIGTMGVKTPSDNDVGKVAVKDYMFQNGTGLPYQASCDIPKNTESEIYLTTKVPLQSYGGGWYRVNDYLSMRSSTQVGGHRNEYILNPFTSESNEYEEKNGNLTNWFTGGRGKIDLRIDKKFIGISDFNILAVEGYANTYKDRQSSEPIFELFIKGSVSVPQSCELDAGTTITMDFGDIGASQFSQAGAGNKPDGVNPKTHAISVKCKNIDAQALLSMRIETSDASGNAMVSDNKDVGFIVADGHHMPLKPNDIDSKFKFQLDDNSQAQVPITAWPVSVTGKKPAEGKFTAEGYLRVDFD